MKLVKFENLEKDVWYFIYYGYVERPIKHMGLFKNYVTSEYGNTIAKFDKIKNIPKSKSYVSEIYFGLRNRTWNFLKIEGFTAQNDMERRAINLILQQITGDSSFVWW